MKKISITGIGIITNLGSSVENVWETLSQTEAVTVECGPIKYQSILKPIQRRRMNRYSDMTLYTAAKAMEDANITTDEVGEYNIGTIYTTGYGPEISNIKFAESVIKGDPDMCSPTVFANTVQNACIGNVCIQLGLKGVSTISFASNNLSYSQMLLSKGDAEYILTGSIEEYCGDLEDSFKKDVICKDIPVKEAAVTLITKVYEEKDQENEYAHIEDIIEGSFPYCPILTMQDEKECAGIIREMAEEIKGKYEFDAIFTSSNGSYFDSVEESALKDVFGTDVTYVNNVKQLAGETLGSAYNVNVGVAAICLKKGKLPVQLDFNGKSIQTVLVTGYDVSGNYSLTVLKR